MNLKSIDLYAALVFFITALLSAIAGWDFSLTLSIMFLETLVIIGILKFSGRI